MTEWVSMVYSNDVAVARVSLGLETVEPDNHKVGG